MASTIKFDWAEVNKAIYDLMHVPVDEAAAKIAANVDVGTVTDAKVGVRSEKTGWGWPVARVTIMHPAGMAMQAKDGTLTKAAASIGLEVKSKASE